MASDSSNTASASQPTVAINSTSPSPNLITINTATQLPLKLSSLNYFSWKAQFTALFFGLDLIGYIDGSLPCPPATTTTDGKITPNPAHMLWLRQDQLILHAIFASLTETVIPLVSSARSSFDAWSRLHRLYGKRSHQHIIHLKDKLQTVTRGSRSVQEFLLQIKTISDELTVLGSPPSDADLLLYCTRGLGPAYKEVIAALHTRDTIVPFEELYSKLVDHETFLHHVESKNNEPPPPTVNLAKTPHPSNFRPSKKSYPSSAPGILPTPPHPSRDNKTSNSNPIICQYCEKRGHDAKHCFKLFPHLRPNRPSVNHVTTTSPQNHNWILDSGASHHVTSNLSNLSLHHPYEGPDDIVIGDGSGLKITHTGSTTLSPSFSLSNVLCAPNIHTNLISVSQFCRSNKTSIEFFPSFFVVKDLRTGDPLLRGRNRHDLYEWPSLEHTNKRAAMALSSHFRVHASPAIWHGRLGHPSVKIIKYLASSGSVSLSSNFSSTFHCQSCECNKSQRLPFAESSLVSRGPLDLVYTDVWGPSPIPSVKGFRYYVIFVDHYTRYVWLYPLRLKSDVFSIFRQFKALVENHFNTKIVTVYSDGGGEYTALKDFLSTLGIQHLKTPPHTPQHNGMAERRHKHIVDTGLTLLYQAKVPHKYWSYAFQTAVYLINRLPTPILNFSSPYEKLFQVKPNYNKLRIFGCLCFPWLKPYTSHKLEPKSLPCVFLGYSLNQSAYICLEPTSNKIYHSRHVRFVESEFPLSHSSSISIPTLNWFPTLDESPVTVLSRSTTLSPPSMLAPVLTVPAPSSCSTLPLAAQSSSISAVAAGTTSFSNPLSSSLSISSTVMPSPPPTSTMPTPSVEPVQLSQPHSILTTCPDPTNCFLHTAHSTQQPHAFHASKTPRTCS